MARVIIGEDCGNSPKNILLKNLTVAIVNGDVEFILASVTDDICWNIVGSMLIRGKDDFAEVLEQMKSDKATTLTIKHIATHGKAGAVDGTIKMKNGKTRAFCDVYEFGNAKGTRVKEITSYMIVLK